MANVIDVDFRPPKTPGEMLEDLREDVVEIRSDLQAAAQWEKHQTAWLRSRIRRLEDQLRSERQGQFFDDDVYAAARSIGSLEAFAATAVAERLLRCPSHSAIVRVGLALSRLEKTGLLERLPLPTSPSDHRANRWRVVARGRRRGSRRAATGRTAGRLS